ncbi:roundabout homolog 2-like [Phlebotomus papatasi]|uniref:roundabout homolog 2-like n=1 Tax=Phlebotomus papatasi TaxID=29031 RepID=UPI002483995D|nr:roundabout homolog 2-like [Phlebotomus papatasi]
MTQLLWLFVIVMYPAFIQGQVPRITEHPTDTTVARHDPATLNCKVQGTPTPTIQWYKDGVPLKILPGSHRLFLPAGGLFFLKVVNSRRESDSGVYWCEARNQYGVARSRNATLVVAVLREDFRLEPQNTRVAQGDTALIECGPPKGTPEPRVDWRKNGQKLELENSKRIRIVDGGNLAIQDVRQTDEGQYQCVAKNAAGTRESTAALLKVHVKPFLIRGPTSQVVVEGSAVTFQCRVGGDPMPDVLWRRSASGGNMPLDRVHILEDRSLRLERVTVNDEGEYSCEADNAVGSITATGTLTVHSPPVFTARPTAQSVDVPASASFECRATGIPQPTMFWSIEGNRSLIFPGSRLDRFETTFTAEGVSVLTLPQTKRTDNGIIVICSALNSVGSITARAKLIVNSVEDNPPPIIIQGPVNQTLPVKSVAVLVCRSSGVPTPVVSWYRDGIPVVTSHKINMTESGTLTISDLSRNEDQGLYTCVASSRNGKSTWSGFLRLEQPTNPNIKFFRAPESATFPAAPSKPLIVNVTDESVTISWIPGGKTGASEIQGYTVEMFSSNISKGWIPLVQRHPDTTYTQYSLTLGATYVFIVRSENYHGLSPPSPMSDPIVVGGKALNAEEDIGLSEAQAILSSGNVVELLEANATDSTSVRLSWEIINGQYVEGFYIYSRETVTNGTYKMLTVLHGGGASACTMTGLKKYHQYEFFIVPFYKTVEGRPSNSRTTRTLEDVPSAPPEHIEAILLNATAVYLKWHAPSNDTINGILLSYQIIVRGFDSHNLSKILTNITIDAKTPSLLLANLSAGVTYSVSVSAGTGAGFGPFSPPAILRLDPHSRRLDNSFTRYSINHNLSDDILTQTWFIVLLGSIIAIIVFLFGAMVLFKRIQFIKQTSLASMHGNHAIGTVRKFPTLPLNTGGGTNGGAGGGTATGGGVWIDPSGGVWRHAKDGIPDYAQISATQTLPLPDYERLTPLNMPDYAEVAGVSSFKHPKSPLYDSCGAYATTSLIGTTNIYHQNRIDAKSNSIYSAPTSCHYGINDGLPYGVDAAKNAALNHHANVLQRNSAHHGSHNRLIMNITENRMNLINNLSRPSTSTAVPQTPMLGTMRRNRLMKLSQSGDGRNGKVADGSWTPSPSALDTTVIGSGANTATTMAHHFIQATTSDKNSSQNYLSSFGRTDNV